MFNCETHNGHPKIKPRLPLESLSAVFDHLDIAARLPVATDTPAPARSREIDCKQN
jgi:hypothetical protein